ncbi:MAG TPA: iron ABC transporter permease [Stellaceae bacterium]|nr:iron ABC transporter permease [Stellaceae bacterium]
MPIGRVRLEGQYLLFTILLALVAVMVLLPIGIIVIKSFTIGGFGKPTIWSLAGWHEALDDPTMLASVWNSLRLLVGIEAISIPTSVTIAWLLGRTDLPQRGALEFAFWITFFLPALSVTLGWIVLLDPQSGLLNKLALSLPFIHAAPFNIYSFWGIIWAHLATSSISVKVMLLTPAFRNLDGSFEEAARVVGAGRLKTMVMVIVPLMLPAILTVLTLAMIRAMQNFEIEMVLGPPFDFFVYGTKIYRLIEQEPPQFGAATALASIGLVIIAPMILMQRRLITRRSYSSITGRMRLAPMKLGRWRLPIFATLLAFVVLVTVTPVSFLVVASFMKLFGFFSIPHPFTIGQWSSVLQGQDFLAALSSTLKMATGAAVVAVVLCSLVAYFTVRSRYAGRGALDFLSWLPFSIPGILLGLGLLQVFLGSPILRFLYGSITLLVVAIVIAGMTFGTQVLKTNMLQLGAELEDAARVTGATWWKTLRGVVVPIVMPSLILVGVLNFISASRDISSVALLATNNTKTLSLLQLDYMIEGRYEAAAVISVVIVILTTGVAVIARLLGLRLGVRH